MEQQEILNLLQQVADGSVTPQQAQLQLTGDPRPLPHMHINPSVKDIFSFQYEDFTLTDYDPHPHIKATVSV